MSISNKDFTNINNNKGHNLMNNSNKLMKNIDKTKKTDNRNFETFLNHKKYIF